jgi:voltage-gated potassium channel Kch
MGVIGLSSVAIYLVEGGINRSIETAGDALCWTLVTVTTVGYGDVSPVTLEGRVIAVVLMLTGIGVIGVFTATVASLLFEHGSQDNVARLEERLTRVEAKLDERVPFGVERGEQPPEQPPRDRPLAREIERGSDRCSATRA